MDYHVRFDSSGTDDDIPVQNINRVGRGVLRLTENRSMRVPTSAQQRAASPGVDEQVHDLELGAYNAVLKAFIAQSDDLSWGKEKLISQLRKELKVSDVEHRESLATVDADELVRHIREWRKGATDSKELLSHGTLASGMVRSTLGSNKKLKSVHVTTASPSANYMPRVQSSMAVTSSHLTVASPNYVPQVQSSTAVVHPSQWGEDAYVNQGNEAQCVKYMGHGGQLPVAGKGRGSLKVHTGKSYASLPAEGVKKGADIIEIRETHVIIHEVERVFAVENPNPALVQKAKMILKEHEQSLLEAIAKVDNMSDIGP